MELLDMLLSGVGVLGNALDTPGGAVRNALSGRNMFDGLNPFDAEGRASGRDMLESWGWAGENQDGLDMGDLAGFAAEIFTDPTNLIGGKAAFNAYRAGAKGKQAASSAADAARIAADEASREAARISAENAARSAHNSLVDVAKYKADDIVKHDQELQKWEAARGEFQKRVSGRADSTFKPNEISPSEYYHFDEHGYDRYSVASDPAKRARMLTALRGPQHMAARALAEIAGLTPVDATDELTKRVLGQSGVYPTGYVYNKRKVGSKGKGVQKHLGFVWYARPDIAFLADPKSLATHWNKKYPGFDPPSLQYHPFGTAAHEAVHNLARLHPAEYDRMIKLAGNDALDKGATIYEGRIKEKLDPPSYRREEGMATMVDQAVRLGEADPLSVAQMHEQWAKLGYGKQNPSLDPKDHPHLAELAQIYNDFLTGKTRRKTALTRTGKSEPLQSHRFTHPGLAPPPLTEAEAMALGEGYKELLTLLPLLPQADQVAVAEAVRKSGGNIQDALPLIEKLLGYNLGRTGFSRSLQQPEGDPVFQPSFE